ncbi:MAG: glycosyltransferase family 2 protein [Gammaproteobacteria bacterium]|nr:glycosyltransferase family 2 protein [Gammaproteobacteria bacterium]
MTVAIVIVSYNSGELLDRCLAALSEQTCKPDRILVVDNASSDPATLSLLATLDNAEVIYSDVNLGYGAAINSAAENLTDIDYLCSLNPDAFPEPRWLENLMIAALRNPEYGSFAPLMLKANLPHIIDGAGDLLHISGIPWRRYHGVQLGSVDLVEEPVFSPCAGAALYNLQTFRQVGGFDESFFMYVEDIDIGFRLQLAGHPCLFVPNAVVHHIGSATTGRTSDFTVYHGHRNVEHNYFKNVPSLLLLLTLPLHLTAVLMSLAVFSTRGNMSAIWRAKRDALLSLPRYISNRATSKPKVALGYIWKILDKSFIKR